MTKTDYVPTTLEECQVNVLKGDGQLWDFPSLEDAFLYAECHGFYVVLTPKPAEAWNGQSEGYGACAILGCEDCT